MTPFLEIMKLDSKTIRVQRDPSVSAVLWSKVRAEWGTNGPDPNRVVDIPIEVFLSNLDWVFDACQSYMTGILWDERAKEIVIRTRNEQESVLQILNGVTPIAERELEERLRGSRFVRSLRDFQKRDLGWLLALPNGANFSVPGAGKTTVTYALYEAERTSGRIERLLVVAPLSAFDAWETEAQDCFSETLNVHCFDGSPIPHQAEIVVVTYQRLQYSYKDIADWVQSASCQVVLDEAHRMKRGWQGSWGRHSLLLSRLAVRRDVLTGTPAPQGIRDIEALIDFIWPTQARRILPREVFERTPPKNMAAQVGNIIAPLFVRTTKSELNLPEPNLSVMEVPLTGLQREIYHALRNQYAGVFLLSRTEKTNFAKMGRVVMYLLEAATNPAILPIGGRPDPITSQPRFPPMEIPIDSALSNLIENYPDHELPPKLIALAELVHKNARAKKKTLVWTNFVSNIEFLRQTFAALAPATIYGQIPSEVSRPTAKLTREAELNRFRNDDSCLILIANPASMSEGVSLHQTCHDAVYLDRTFNAGQYLQSIDRIHRLGMPDVDTNITFLLTQETIDVTVNNRIRDKADQLGKIMSDQDISTMALPDEDCVEEVLDSGTDLEALFAHLRGEDISPEAPSKR